jgi:hypothetical protein
MTTLRWLLRPFAPTIYFWLGMLAGAALAVVVQFLTVAILMGGAL